MQRFSADARKAKTARYVKVEDVLLTWFREVTAAVVNVDGTILLKKASDIALSLRVDDFQASSGCIHRFKTRRGLGYKTVSGERKKVDESAISDWVRSTLPSLIAGYEARNIFNANEAGVYYDLQLEKSLSFKGDACKAARKASSAWQFSSAAMPTAERKYCCYRPVSETPLLQTYWSSALYLQG